MVLSDRRSEPRSDARLLGELLVERGLVTPADLSRALAFQQQYPGRLGSVLVRLGAVSEENLLPVLSEQIQVPLLQTDEWPEEGSVHAALEAARLAPDWWHENEAVAWVSGERVLIAGRDPLDPGVNELLAARLGDLDWAWRLCGSQDLSRLLDLISADRSDTGEAHDEDDVSHLRELAEEAPVIELVNNILSQAMDLRASDVHIEPEPQACLVRMRVDGILQTRLTLQPSRYPAVASRVKLISGMDIAERRLPQDGRLSLRVSGQDVDVRVSAVPAVHGESLVLRLLPKERKDLDLSNLGFHPRDLRRFREWTREPHGIVLVTGPTGSGKSTTLYGALEEINDSARKILTVEDPVEFQVKGVTQIQANSEIGYTFARALRAILRQDPDVIMIGEIRDLETAEIAVQSSLTGHLVLSTLHTNDAVSAFTRLIDMGVEPFLVRRLCRHCSVPAHVLPAVEAAVAGLAGPAPEPPDWRRAVGCPACQGTGYRGRLGIYELVDVTERMQELILARAPAERLRALASEQGGRTLREDGLLKARQGVTSVEEVVRVTGGTVDDG
jgi:general secretion pathway protein E